MYQIKRKYLLTQFNVPAIVFHMNNTNTQTKAADATQSAFEIIVGNIGTVYSGSNFMKASCKFAEYVKQSKTGYGRAGGEDVTLMHNGEPRKEHAGSNANQY